MSDNLSQNEGRNFIFRGPLLTSIDNANANAIEKDNLFIRFEVWRHEADRRNGTRKARDDKNSPPRWCFPQRQEFFSCSHEDDPAVFHCGVSWAEKYHSNSEETSSLPSSVIVWKKRNASKTSYLRCNYRYTRPTYVDFVTDHHSNKCTWTCTVLVQNMIL